LNPRLLCYPPAFWASQYGTSCSLTRTQLPTWLACRRASLGRRGALFVCTVLARTIALSQIQEVAPLSCQEAPRSCSAPTIPRPAKKNPHSTFYNVSYVLSRRRIFNLEIMCPNDNINVHELYEDGHAYIRCRRNRIF
jgi:hypothetical protein